MKAMRIAVVAVVLVGLVAATVKAGSFNASVTGKLTTLKSGVVTTKSFSSKDLIAVATTNKTAKLVVDSSTGALQIVDGCGNLITNIVTVLGADLTIGPDASSNQVQAVLLSFAGTGATNGAGVVSISNGKTFKASETFQIAVSGVILQGKVTTSSAFKAAHGCP
jgi:hypothetical protein